MGRPSIYMRSCWEGRSLDATRSFPFFEQNCEMTFSGNM
jgi:hypothetical protein